jgi:hypothetical protein
VHEVVEVGVVGEGTVVVAEVMDIVEGKIPLDKNVE